LFLPSLLALRLTGLPLAPAAAPAWAAPDGPVAVYLVDRDDDAPAATACTGAANDCSLRGAIGNANANPGAVVQLQAGHIYNLTHSASGDLQATANTTILPAGVCFICFTIIQGGPGWNDRLLHVTDAARAMLVCSRSSVGSTAGAELSDRVWTIGPIYGEGVPSAGYGQEVDVAVGPGKVGISTAGCAVGVSMPEVGSTGRCPIMDAGAIQFSMISPGCNGTCAKESLIGRTLNNSYVPSQRKT
jgi:hypothetical protein